MQPPPIPSDLKSFTVRLMRAGSNTVEALHAQASTAAQLRARLQREGAIVLHIRPSPSRPVAQAPRKSTRFDVGWWCRELRTLLVAGMTVVEAIETLAAGSRDPTREHVHITLLKALREGRSLSRAMVVAEVFPQVLIASVMASERTSTLAMALDDYLRYDELLRKLRQQLVSAAIYPLVVMSLGAVISLFLLLFVVPRFARMYADLQGPVSGATQIVLWISTAVQQQWPWLLLAVGAATAITGWAWRSGVAGSFGAWLLESISWLERAGREFHLAKLYQAMSLMVKGGYTVDETLQVCANLKAGPRMAIALQAVREAIARGKTASAALAGAGLTEVVTERLLAVGERTGSFASVLQAIADRHSQAFITFVDRATRVVEPLLLLLVALAVGAIVLLMYMPIFDIAGGLGIATGV